MPLIQFHTQKGIVEVDSDTITDQELTTLGITRQALNELLPRDLQVEVDDIKARLSTLEQNFVKE